MAEHTNGNQPVPILGPKPEIRAAPNANFGGVMIRKLEENGTFAPANVQATSQGYQVSAGRGQFLDATELIAEIVEGVSEAVRAIVREEIAALKALDNRNI